MSELDRLHHLYKGSLESGGGHLGASHPNGYGVLEKPTFYKEGDAAERQAPIGLLLQKLAKCPGVVGFLNVTQLAGHLTTQSPPGLIKVDEKIASSIKYNR